MSEDVYTRLARFLDKMPGGFPSTESGVEIKILKKFFTPEEAELTMHLTLMPEPVSAIAARAGMDESKAAEMLESMAKQGSILRVRGDGKPHYAALSFVVGIYEFHLNSIDRELAELMEEYLPHLGAVWAQTKTKQLRVVPVASALESTPTVATHNQIRELVKKQELASVAPCICRKEQALMGHPCDRPLEMCLQFGVAAQYYIENEMARQITIDEALKLLDRAEEEAMVFSVTNAQDLVNICCCCGCCCGLLRGLKLLPKPAEQVNSAYQAKIDPDLCSACETCLERCQIDAIRENGDVMEVNTDRCIGCGLCVSTCPEEAINLVPRADAVAPPKSLFHTMTQIMKERGLA